MWTRPYGKTGKDVSVIGFGGMRFDNPEDIDANADLVLHAYRRGVNYFDTAPLYCKDKSEDIVGAAVRQMTPGTFYVSTKSNKADGGALRADLEKSLRRLGVERIHFFHIWCVVTLDAWKQRVAGGAVAAALKAKQAGLVEHVVISSHLPGNELAGVLREACFEGVTLGYCALNFPYRDEAVEVAGRTGLGVVTMNPLGGGMIPQQAEKLQFLRAKDDPSVVAAALRFNLSNPAVTCALVGFTTKRHVDQAVDAVENFTPHTPERIESIREHIIDSFDGFCTGCGYCLPCPEGVPIRQFMDVYNMKILADAKPAKMLERLRWHWELRPEAAAACSDCGDCEARCTQHLPIRERLAETAAITRAAKEDTTVAGSQ